MFGKLIDPFAAKGWRKNLPQLYWLGLILGLDLIITVVLYRGVNCDGYSTKLDLLLFFLRVVAVPYIFLLGIRRGSPQSVISITAEEDFDDILWIRRKIAVGYLFLLTTASQVLLGIKAASFDSAQLANGVGEFTIAGLMFILIFLINLELWQTDRALTMFTSTEGIPFEGLHAHPLHYKPNGIPLS